MYIKQYLKQTGLYKFWMKKIYLRTLGYNFSTIQRCLNSNALFKHKYHLKVRIRLLDVQNHEDKNLLFANCKLPPSKLKATKPHILRDIKPYSWMIVKKWIHTALANNCSAAVFTQNRQTVEDSREHITYAWHLNVPTSLQISICIITSSHHSKKYRVSTVCHLRP